MGERWVTPKKSSRHVLREVSTATRYKDSRAKEGLWEQAELESKIQPVAQDNVLLVELLSSNKRHNEGNLYLKNKYTLGLILQQTGFIKDLLNQHTILGRFWKKVGQLTILSTFVCLQMILKDKRSPVHAEILFKKGSQDLQYLKSINSEKLRRGFWEFVTNRISRTRPNHPTYQIKIVNPPCKTIKLDFSRKDQLVEIIDDFLQLAPCSSKTFSRMPSEMEFKKMVWGAWDSKS